jgi:hypothetical protein
MSYFHVTVLFSSKKRDRPGNRLCKSSSDWQTGLFARRLFFRGSQVSATVWYRRGTPGSRVDPGRPLYKAGTLRRYRRWKWVCWDICPDQIPRHWSTLAARGSDPSDTHPDRSLINAVFPVWPTCNTVRTWSGHPKGNKSTFFRGHNGLKTVKKHRIGHIFESMYYNSQKNAILQISVL